MRALFSVYFACTLAVFGQSVPRDAASNSSTAFRADSTLVLVPVSVTDPSNRFVLGLAKEDFRLFEDDVEQKVTHFSSEDAPLSIGLLVDTSGSMGAKLDTSRRAVSEFLKTLNKADEAFLVEFSDRAQLAVPLTSDAGAIESSMTSATSGGLTALLDAVNMGLQEMKRAKNPRKALLDYFRRRRQQQPVYVRPDRRPGARSGRADLCHGRVRTDAVVWVRRRTLGTAELDGPRLLSAIADQTGGRALAATNLARAAGDCRAHRHRAAQSICAGLFAASTRTTTASIERSK